MLVEWQDYKHFELLLVQQYSESTNGLEVASEIRITLLALKNSSIFQVVLNQSVCFW